MSRRITSLLAFHTKRRLTVAAILFAAAFPTALSAAEPPQERSAHVSRTSAYRLELDRRLFLDPRFRDDFPRLGADFEVLAPSSRDYNCIAWSLGITDHWVNPETGPDWNPLGLMNEKYAAQGYRRLAAMEVAYRPGREKVAIYATLQPDGSIDQVAHAARQLPDGSWTSKCGSMALIRHESLEALRGPVRHTGGHL